MDNTYRLRKERSPGLACVCIKTIKAHFLNGLLGISENCTEPTTIFNCVLEIKIIIKQDIIKKKTSFRQKQVCVSSSSRPPVLSFCLLHTKSKIILLPIKSRWEIFKTHFVKPYNRLHAKINIFVHATTCQEYTYNNVLPHVVSLSRSIQKVPSLDPMILL